MSEGAAVSEGSAAGSLTALCARVDELEQSDHVGRIAALTELLDHPTATSATLDIAGILDELHHHHRAIDRFDEAIAAKRAAIAAGYVSTPDPEADIAEIYVEQGRTDAAADLFATLHQRAPDDVWLYNSAAWAYRNIDPAESLRWALEGIDTALRTGDPDGVVGQLRDFATGAWTALGVAEDAELLERVDTFVEQWRPPSRWSYTPPATMPPATDPSSGLASDTVRHDALRSAGAAAVGFAWFPAAEWVKATARWPALLGSQPADHQDYNRALEAELKAFQRRGSRDSLHVSPITIDELDSYAAEHGRDPGSSEARALLAAEVARTDRAVTWPPKRNDRCWCRSGRKYKLCCGPTPAAVPRSQADG